jgi:hypothetical protein
LVGGYCFERNDLARLSPLLRLPDAAKSKAKVRCGIVSLCGGER